MAWTTKLAATLGLTGVGLGAFGAHGLKNLLAANGTAAIWETAVLYHLVHAVASLWAAGRSRLVVSLWSAGILIFSGSLYILAITNLRWLGAITPIGGILLLAGWAAVILRKE
jgi:uncharacterized membrane protein YgdD (TMEM256/DUF423 family)